MIYAQVPYRIEPELTILRPRRVRFTLETQKRRFRAYCVAFLPLVIVVVYGLKAVEYQEALLTRGKVTSARIINIVAFDYGRVTNYNRDQVRSILFKFRANDRDVLGKGYDQSEFHKNLVVGDTILVTFLPEHPQSVVQGKVTYADVVRKDLDWLIGSSFVTIISVSYLFLVERYFWQRRRLLRDGKAVAAMVIGHQTAESGETATCFVRYEYPDAKGTKIAGRLAVNPKRAREFPDGSRLTILCLPDSNEPGMPYVSITEAEIVQIS